MAKGKKSGDDDLLENFEDLSEEDQQLLAFDELEAEDDSAEIEKKSMTNVQPKDLNTFFAGRGKRDSRGAAGDYYQKDATNKLQRSNSKSILYPIVSTVLYLNTLTLKPVITPKQTIPIPCFNKNCMSSLYSFN
jgi:hypothetical protein